MSQTEGVRPPAVGEPSISYAAARQELSVNLSCRSSKRFGVLTRCKAKQEIVGERHGSISSTIGGLFVSGENKKEAGILLGLERLIYIPFPTS